MSEHKSVPSNHSPEDLDLHGCEYPVSWLLSDIITFLSFFRLPSALLSDHYKPSVCSFKTYLTDRIQTRLFMPLCKLTHSCSSRLQMMHNIWAYVGTQWTLNRFKFELTFTQAESQRSPLILSQLIQGTGSNQSSEV